MCVDKDLTDMDNQGTWARERERLMTFGAGAAVGCSRSKATPE